MLWPAGGLLVARVSIGWSNIIIRRVIMPSRGSVSWLVGGKQLLLENKWIMISSVALFRWPGCRSDGLCGYWRTKRPFPFACGVLSVAQYQTDGQCYSPRTNEPKRLRCLVSVGASGVAASALLLTDR